MTELRSSQQRFKPPPDPVRHQHLTIALPVCSLAIRSIRVRGKPQPLARVPADIFSGTRNSSRRTSPGCIGLSFLAIAPAHFFLAALVAIGCEAVTLED